MNRKEIAKMIIEASDILDGKGMHKEASILDGVLEKVAQYGMGQHKAPGEAEGNLSFKQLEATTWMRLLEMTVESQTTKMNDVGLTMQFFKDLRTYGLNEAIAYVKSYEKDGDYQPGTAAKLEEIKAKAIANLSKPMTKQKKYVLDDYKLEEIGNRFMKIENQLPYVNKNTIVDDAWVQKFAELTKIPVEVAYVWATNEWQAHVLSPEVTQKSQELQSSGKVVIDL